LEIRLNIKGFKVHWFWVMAALVGALSVLNLVLWILSGDIAWLSGFITATTFGAIGAELFTYEQGDL
jgi:hypothetical protein